MNDKNKAKQSEKEERAQYDIMQAEHVKLLGEKENEKSKQYAAKVVAEKESRDRQLKLEKQRRRVQQKVDYNQELELVERL